MRMQALMENDSARELHTAKRDMDWHWGNTDKEAFENFKKEMEQQAKEKKMELKWVKKR